MCDEVSGENSISDQYSQMSFLQNPRDIYFSIRQYVSYQRSQFVNQLKFITAFFYAKYMHI